ncbi:ubiquitin ligase [Fusarium denticulatum]|uniref:Ubiquitin ligase n=1 Tax=Fusarium denticulatum TaxID=48507 RepID=A0A8H5T9Q8_9HYPO|nr:ubiquitin ligase [Fusarium denticulatum]
MSQESIDLLPFSQPFHPTLAASRETREDLARLLLPELARPIISLVYNPWLATRRDDRQDYRAQALDHGFDDEHSIAAWYLSTEPIPEPTTEGLSMVTPQRIVFQTRAADQGWATFGGDGTFENSHTWFEASILRSVGQGCQQNESNAPKDALRDRSWWDIADAREDLRAQGWEFVEGENGRLSWRVCNNLTASSEFRNYTVEWRRNIVAAAEDERAIGNGEGFLQLLGPGCIVVLWARAEQRFWVNKVEGATIEIEYEFL